MSARSTAVTLLIPDDDQAARAALFDLLAAHPRVHLAREGPVQIRSSLLAELSPRELDVLRCIARGLTNRAIAGELGLAEGTVRNSVSAVIQKLGVANRAEAVARLAEMNESAASTPKAI